MSMKFNRFYNKLSKNNMDVNIASYDDKLISSVPAEKLTLPKGYSIENNKVYHNNSEIGRFSYRGDVLGATSDDLDLDLDAIDIDTDDDFDLDAINIPSEDKDDDFDLDAISIPSEDKDDDFDLDGINIVPSKATSVPKTTIDDTELVNEGHVFPSYEIKEEFTTQEQQELLEKINKASEELKSSFLTYESNKYKMTEDERKSIENYKTAFVDLQKEMDFSSKEKTEEQLNKILLWKKTVDNANGRIFFKKNVDINNQTEEPVKKNASALNRIKSAKEEDLNEKAKEAIIKEYSDLIDENRSIAIECTSLDYIIYLSEAEFQKANFYIQATFLIDKHNDLGTLTSYKNDAKEANKELKTILENVKNRKEKESQEVEKRSELKNEFVSLFHENEKLCVVCNKLRDYLVETGEDIEYNSLARCYHVLPDLSGYSIESIENMIKDAKFHKERLHDMVVNAKAKKEAKEQEVAKKQEEKVVAINSLLFTLKQVAEIKKAKEEKSKKIKNALAKLKERDDSRKAEAEARRIKNEKDQKEANEILSKIKGLLDQGQEIVDKARMNDIAFPYYVKYEKEGSTSIRSDIQFVYEEREYKYYKDAFAANISSVTIEELRKFYDEVLKHFNSFKSYIDDTMKLKNTTSKVIDEIKDNNQDSKIVIPNFLRLPNEEDLADKRRKDIEDSEKALEKARLARENARLEKERKELEEKEQARRLAQAKKEAEEAKKKEQEIIVQPTENKDLNVEIYETHSVSDIRNIDNEIKEIDSRVEEIKHEIELIKVEAKVALEVCGSDSVPIYKEKLENLENELKTLKIERITKKSTVQRFTNESIRLYEESEQAKIDEFNKAEEAMNIRLEQEALEERNKNRKEITKLFKNATVDEISPLAFKSNSEVKRYQKYIANAEAEGKNVNSVKKEYLKVLKASIKNAQKLKEMELAMGIIKEDKKKSSRKK